MGTLKALKRKDRASQPKSTADRISAVYTSLLSSSERYLSAKIFLRAPKAAELELELIQTRMTQKPMLRGEVYARALRASQNRK